MNIMKMLQVAVLLFVLIVEFSIASPSCGGYGQDPCFYLPAKPGQTPPCASKGSTFCETVEGYPENLIQKLLKNYVTRDILADETKIDFNARKDSFTKKYIIPPYGYDYEQSGGHAFGYSSNGPFDNYGNLHESPSSNQGPRQKRSVLNETTPEASQLSFNRFLNVVQSFSRSKRQTNPNREQLCEVRSNYINPQAALNVRTGNWMFIVNGLETATQLVRTETCVSDRCSNLCQLPNGYNSRCEQKYVQKRLVTLDPQGEKLFTDTFWFPSCCVCTLSNFIE